MDFCGLLRISAISVLLMPVTVSSKTCFSRGLNTFSTFCIISRTFSLSISSSSGPVTWALVILSISSASSLPSAPSAVEALLAFGDECLATGRFDTRLPVAWARSRFIATSLPGADWEAPFRGELAITNMNRVADSVLASPRSDKCSRRNALYMRIWPLYANNDFEELVRTCDAFGQAEGNWDAQIHVALDGTVKYLLERLYPEKL